MKKIILVALGAFVMHGASAKTSSIEDMRAQVASRTGGNPYAGHKQARPSLMQGGKMTEEQVKIQAVHQQMQAYMESLYSSITPEARSVVGLAEQAVSEELEPLARKEAVEIARLIKEKLSKAQLVAFIKALEKIYTIAQEAREFAQTQNERQMQTLLSKLYEGLEDPLFAAIVIYSYEMPILSVVKHAAGMAFQQEELSISPEAIQRARKVVVIFAEELITELNSNC